MTQRASESLVAVLIRIGLLLALAVLLMAENAQAQTADHFTRVSSGAERQSNHAAAPW
jgi:type III secretory pathway component EscT